MSGSSVIDLETTGFAYTRNYRICEVAVVLSDANGRRQDSWSTLINPQRDLGAQHILACGDSVLCRLLLLYQRRDVWDRRVGTDGDLPRFVRPEVSKTDWWFSGITRPRGHEATSHCPIGLASAEALCHRERDVEHLVRFDCEVERRPASTRKHHVQGVLTGDEFENSLSPRSQLIPGIFLVDRKEYSRHREIRHEVLSALGDKGGLADWGGRPAMRTRRSVSRDFSFAFAT